jgi:hypothetical protein
MPYLCPPAVLGAADAEARGLVARAAAAWSLLSDLAVGKLADDVEVADVAGVLLDQVEQDPLKCRGPVAVPPVARLADVSKVMGFHDGPAARRLGVQRRHKLLESLVGGYVPAAIPVLTPRVGDRAALETPLQPPQLVMGNMLQQLDRRPAGRQPAAAQFAAGQGFKLAYQPGAEIVEVPEEDLGG